MTLLQFIKSKLEEDTPEGDLARDANSDKEFRELKTDKERRLHLEFKTGGIVDICKSFFKEFDAINSK